MPPLRIGVNALYLLPGQVGGTEIYLRQLLAALSRIDHENHYFLYTNSETREDFVSQNDRFHARPQHVAATSRPKRILHEQFTLPRVAHSDRIDVLFNPGFTAPAVATMPMVTVFHDLQHVRHPEYFKRFDLPFWRLLLRQAAARSKRLIAVSETTRADVLRHYHLSPTRVVTIEHGVEDAFFELPRNPDESQPYLLCVSTLHPHKNIDRLLRAFLQLRRTHPDLRLVLAGMRGFHTAQIEQQIRNLNLTEWVSIPGWLPREQLFQLYARAKAFVYPSTFEGFGMPVLEAMAARIPLACSDISPIQEIADGTVLLFHPESEEQMTQALECALEGATHRIASAYNRARTFNWDTAAQKTLAVFESVHQRRPEA